MARVARAADAVAAFIEAVSTAVDPSSPLSIEGLELLEFLEADQRELSARLSRTAGRASAEAERPYKEERSLKRRCAKELNELALINAELRRDVS